MLKKISTDNHIGTVGSNPIKATQSTSEKTVEEIPPKVIPKILIGTLQGHLQQICRVNFQGKCGKNCPVKSHTN